MAASTLPECMSDMNAFRKILASAKHVVALTGAGVSAESGVPTFRGAGGLWRKFQAQQVATPSAFKADPSLVWEFYSYRREVMLTKSPNSAHKSLAEFEDRFTKQEDCTFTLLTQNIDRLHQVAGSKNIIELHGSLFFTRCTSCLKVEENYDSPICPALKDKGSPDPNAKPANIPLEDLPRCKHCQSLLRPNVVWFGEPLDIDVVSSAQNAMDNCDLFLVIGTSSVVYPAALYGPMLATKGIPVAEFNIETTGVTEGFKFYFQGKCGEILPSALAPLPELKD